ncbi:MAG: putative drug exporter of the superfamily, partial [Actinomycetota bacterium]|nr:putative drug exporter of the superfamily [Actinomycetota bacterium]
MLTRLAQFLIRRRRAVLIGTFVFVMACGAIGGNVATHLSSGGFDDKSSESFKADAALQKTFGTGQPNLVLLLTAKGGATVDNPAVAASGGEVLQQLTADPSVEQAVSYWSLNNAPPLKSKSQTQALVLARLKGSQDDVANEIKVLSPKLTGDHGAVSVRVGGFAEIFRQVGTTIQDDLKKAEEIALPITLLLLVLVFGSLVAASLPLAVGAVAVMGTFLVLRVISSLTEVSIFSLNLTTAMGLGLAIDYSLFVVSRFREELRHGKEPHAAVIRTVETAGRTVVVSALTVAISLSALLLFPLSFLKSFAYAGIGVVAMAAAGAVILLPALLAALGTKVDKGTLFRRHPAEVGEGFWHRVAMFVMARPVPIAAAVIAICLFLGTPFLRASFGLPDDRVLPKSASSRQVSDEIRTNFQSNEAGALSVVAIGSGNPTAQAPALAAYASTLSKLPHVARVDAFTGSYVNGTKVFDQGPGAFRYVRPDATFLAVVPNIEPLSKPGEQLVRSVRAVPAPFAVQVTGSSAQLVDSKHGLFGRLPLAGLIIAIVTFTVLFLMFGSVLVPIKAVVLNLLSLSATYGAMVWIFQEGHLSKTLGFTATGTLDTTTPILMFCIAFGLSMDYEVFLLSRMKE